jgi:nucleoside-diphosphate-sugar epimerase
MEAVLAASGVKWLVLRLSHVVGVGQQPHQLIPALVSQVRSGVVTVYRNAHRDLIDVRDVLWGLDRLLATGSVGQVVNVSTGMPVHIERIISGIECRVGASVRREVIDMGLIRKTVSNAKLCALVPEWHSLDFGPNYLSALLDRYVGPLRDGVTSTLAAGTA